MAHGEVSIALIALGNNASNAGATAPRIRRGMGRAESQRRKARAVGAIIRTLIHTLDEAEGGVPGGVGAAASAFARKSRREMLNLSISVDDPVRTSGRDGGCTNGFMQLAKSMGRLQRAGGADELSRFGNLGAKGADHDHPDRVSASAKARLSSVWSPTSPGRAAMRPAPQVLARPERPGE
jgi:hypothetical protein